MKKCHLNLIDKHEVSHLRVMGKRAGFFIFLLIFLYQGDFLGKHGGLDIAGFPNISSNRVEGLKPQMFNLKGVVTEDMTGEPLENVKVSIVNIRNDFSKELVSDAKGRFSARLMAESVYNVSVEKSRHFTGESYTVSTIGRQSGEPLSLKIKMLSLLEGSVFPLSRIRFDINAPELLSSSEPELDKIFRMLVQNPNLVVEIGCHTDSRGDDYYNLDLSKKRAMSIAGYLMERGISNLRVKARGYGETQPVNECTNGVRCTSIQHMQNRRVELKILNYLE